MRGPPWTWRRRRRGAGRPCKTRYIWFAPRGRVTFIPIDEKGESMEGQPLRLEPDELEALRLVYLEGLTQSEAAERMGVSRGTLWRMLESGRRKLISALVELRPLEILPPSEANRGSS